ncbi:MAG: hypothetical protein KC425_06885, partial [Anaerolineales bacterium]|nr:hypothetical protein [Anaerolineales bacterium]
MPDPTPETLFDRLTTHLAAWHGRRRLRDALLWAPRAGLAGLLLAVVLATVARLRPFLDNTQVGYIALGLGLGGLLAGLLAVLLRRASLLERARFADRQFALRERASTAVEIQQGALAAPPALARQQLADAVRATDAVDARRGLPLRLVRRDWLVLLLALALLAAAVLLPNPQENALKQARAVREQIETQIEALEALEEEILNNPELTEAQREDLLEPVQNALEALDPAGTTQEEAVATLSEAEADLRALEASFSPDDLQARLDAAGQPLAENAASQSLGEALQNGQLAQAGAAAAALADNLPALSAEEQAELAQDLAETAAALAEVDPALAQALADAAQALQAGDVAAAQQALQQAAGTLQQRAQEMAAAQQAQ